MPKKIFVCLVLLVGFYGCGPAVEKEPSLRQELGELTPGTEEYNVALGDELTEYLTSNAIAAKSSMVRSANLVEDNSIFKFPEDSDDFSGEFLMVYATIFLTDGSTLDARATAKLVGGRVMFKYFECIEKVKVGDPRYRDKTF